ncbi:unnamed protein product [Spirodela intermedia]|uniref:Uncharacterized protein n=1 Tax=Spirodela intermedia TaxID=51605 RepID=A0A7I8IHM4_SPIIN|nr:unnamed protein product [Spirodela intermedia]CAA6656876.1 unnamed protein product [Spirodela intermedia]
MGKKGSWFGAVKKVFSPESKEKKNEQPKFKNKWGFGKSKRTDPPSSSLEAASETPAAAPPPRVPAEQVKLTEADSNHVYSVASAAAAAAEAAVVAAQAAAEVVRLTASSTKFLGKSKEEIAAIKIQTAFRGYLESAAGLEGAGSPEVADGSSAIKRQTTTTLRCMQTLARVQSQIRSRRVRMLEENQTFQRQLQLKQERELEALRASIGEDWDDSLQSKEQIEASMLSKHEAAMRRERALAYAFSHQGKGSSKSANPTFTEPGNPQWGWSWVERWMAARPWEGRTLAEKEAEAGSVRAGSLSAGEIAKAFAARRDSLAAPRTSRPPSRRSPLRPVAGGRGRRVPRRRTRGALPARSRRGRGGTALRAPLCAMTRAWRAPPPSRVTWRRRRPPGQSRGCRARRARTWRPRREGAPRLGEEAPVFSVQPVAGRGGRRHSGPPRVDLTVAARRILNHTELTAGNGGVGSGR